MSDIMSAFVFDVKPKGEFYVHYGARLHWEWVDPDWVRPLIDNK
jgi:hypothetical protein